MSAALRLIQPYHDEAELLASFLLGRPETTQRVYRNEVNAFLGFVKVPVHQVQADDLRRYIERCREGQLRPATIRHKVAVIKSFFAFLQQEKKLLEDPMVRVSTPPNPQQDGSRCLSDEQVTAFLGQCPTHRMIGLRDRALFLLAANCGLRLSELSRLSVGDLGDGPDKGWRTLRVHGKGDKFREVQVRPEVWAQVAAYLQRRLDDLVEESPLFASVRRACSIRPQAQDLRIPAATIYKRFKRLARKARLPSWASPHALRHYFASMADAKGASVEAIRRALGHASLAMTQRYLDRLTKGINEAFAAVKVV